MPRVSRSSVRLSQDISNSQTYLEEFVNNCVRYMVYHSNQSEFRKSELQKLVLKNCGRAFDEIINRTKNILKNVYGINLLIGEIGSNKIYFLSSAVPPQTPAGQSDNNDNTEQKQKILLMLVLTHIFMSGGSANETSLYSFLKQLDIETGAVDMNFGNVKDFINQTLIGRKYLQTETDPLTKQLTFKWGIHAEVEISKMQILEFVCKVYGDHQPESWREQYEIATKQNLDHTPTLID